MDTCRIIMVELTLMLTQKPFWKQNQEKPTNKQKKQECCRHLDIFSMALTCSVFWAIFRFLWVFYQVEEWKNIFSLNRVGIFTSWRFVWPSFTSKTWTERSYCTSTPKPRAVQGPNKSPAQTTPKLLKQQRNQFRLQLCATPAVLSPQKKSIKHSNKLVWDTTIILTCPPHPQTLMELSQPENEPELRC